MWSVIVSLTLLKYTDGVVIGNNKKNLHHQMTNREIEYYFGVKDRFKVPEYDVTTPVETESNGRTVSNFHHSRRHTAHPDVMHYKLHAFGSRLQLRMKQNTRLMAPNLVIETHHGGGLVTTRPAPKNKFYLGKVSSDPDSLVALRSDQGLTGMIKTSRETLFVHPLPAHLAKRVRRSTNTVPHLIYMYKPSQLKQSKSGFQTKEQAVKGHHKRSIHGRKPRAAANENTGFRFIEAALIVPQHIVDKYHSDKFATILLIMANMVAAMFQDPSIGKYPVYYVVSKIFHIKNVTELGFTDADPNYLKLNRIVSWSKKYVSKSDADPEHFDVFSYITGKVRGGRAIFGGMCTLNTGNMNGDMGLQTALTVAHETGHNMYLPHDGTPGCPDGTYVMSSSTPSGVYAATWSNCSRSILENKLKSNETWTCLNDMPFESGIRNLSPNYHNQLPGEIFDGNYQCEMQYGKHWSLSPYRPGVCSILYCIKDGTELSNIAPLADGTPCGIRNWCIGGVCEDNGKKRIKGGWSSWLPSYSKCTRSCDGGVQFRSRECDNPSPKNGGKPCEGSDKIWRICNSEPCPANSAGYRAKQCTMKRPGSSPLHYTNPCTLYCQVGSLLYVSGVVQDGTRCYADRKKLDVCIESRCRRVGCDHKLDSNALVDRCGICGGNGDTCVKVKGLYQESHTSAGPSNADVISKLIVGTTGVLFQMKKATQNYLGVKTGNGDYLVGGQKSAKVQTVKAAGTTITYRKNKRKARLTIPGPTNATLEVVYIFTKGSNVGVDYRFKRPVQAGDPEVQYNWKTDPWSSCSVTCGRGVRTRLVRCVISDDQTPASDQACAGKTKPDSQEQCSPINCTSRWLTTPWSDCSKSCGNGEQTRKVLCVMDVSPTEYVSSSNCSEADKPVVPNTLKSCNSFVCYPDWDTKEGLNRDDCGEPIDPRTLSCYRMDERGQKSILPPIMCRFNSKPTRLPCTTPSTPSNPFRPTTRSPTSKNTAKQAGQATQTKCSLLFTLLSLLLHLLEATKY